jgi:hypothetical protein
MGPWARRDAGPQIVTNVAEEIDVSFRPPLALLGLFYALLSAYAVGALRQRWRLLYSLGFIAMSYTLVEGVAMALGGDEEESVWPSLWV